MKKILCILTVISLLLSAIPAFAEDTDTAAQDTAIVDKLYHLGILNDDLHYSYTADGEITRAQFADIVISLNGEKETELTADLSRVFTDVTNDSPYAASIWQAYAAGIMIGDENAAFNPDASITYDEAVKIAVVLIGMYDAAVIKGGYYTGYRESAARAGITNGVAANPEGAISQQAAYRLIDNILDCPLYTITGYQGGEPVVTRDKDATILSDRLGYEIYKGIITACEYTSLKDCTDEVGEGRIRVEENVYDLTYTDASAYVGCKAEIYFNEDDEVVYIQPDKNNKLVKVNASDIQEGTTLTELRYRENGNGREKYLSFTSDTVFIYNGKKLSSPLAEELIPEEGTVTAIDNNSDNKYDVVLIDSYEIYLADSVNVNDVTIKLKNGQGTIDCNPNNDIAARYFMDGERVSLNDIARWNVLSVKRSKNTQGTVLCDVYITTDSVEGAPTASSFDDDDYRVTIDGEEYKLSKSYINRVESGAEDSYYPSMDKSAIFYLDIFGNIAGINTVSAAKNYAYVIRCAYDYDLETAFFKLYTKDGEFVTLNASEKIKINDERVDMDYIPGRLAQNTDNGTVNQLIVYETNKDNEISKIKLAKNKTTEPYYVTKDDEFVLNAHPGINPNSGNWFGIRFYKYLAENYPFYYVEGTTLNFQIPADLSREKDYKIVSKLASTDVSLAGPIYVYDAGNGGTIGAIVSSTRDSTEYCLPLVVSKVMDTIDDDEQPCKLITFSDGTSVYARSEDVSYVYPTKLDNGTKVNWSTRVDYSKLTIDDLAKGDIIEYTKTNGYINTMRYIVKLNDMGLSRVDGDHLAKNGSMLGTVHSVSDNKKSAIIQYNDYDSTERYQSMFINGTVFIIDKETGDTEYGTTGDLNKGDTVLINTFWWSAKLIFVYK